MLYKRTDIEKREATTLAPYAVKSGDTAGRVFDEAPSEFRTCFQRDRDRVIHSKAFRRLMEKTQVFVAHEGDHYRNRMSHSIECAQVSRGLARGLGLNEDLAEAIALAHDLGHTPFGHAGEHALDACMREYGDGEGRGQVHSLRERIGNEKNFVGQNSLHYEHNEQSLRTVEKLEFMYPDFDGLNLSKEVLDGLLKHRTPFDRPKTVFKQSAHLEAQIVDLGDEVAYMSHDLDDGLRAEMFTIDEISSLRVMMRAREINTRKLSSSLMHLLIDDILMETESRLKKFNIHTLDDVRKYDGIIVQFSESMRADVDELRAFLSEHYYFSPRVKEQSERGQKIIQNLFHFYLAHPEKLPDHFQKFLARGESIEIVVKDYVAGMTDGFAEEQNRVYSL